MKVEELRKGNFVEYDKKIVYIAEILLGCVRVYNGFGFDKLTPVECINSIKLKKKHLENIGAKKIKNGYSFDRFLFIEKPEYNYWYVTSTQPCAYMTKIEFIHELQNFIQAMNGEELLNIL